MGTIFTDAESEDSFVYVAAQVFNIIAPYIDHADAPRVFSEVSAVLRRAQEAKAELTALLEASEKAQRRERGLRAEEARIHLDRLKELQQLLEARADRESRNRTKRHILKRRYTEESERASQLLRRVSQAERANERLRQEMEAKADAASAKSNEKVAEQIAEARRVGQAQAKTRVEATVIARMRRLSEKASQLKRRICTLEVENVQLRNVLRSRPPSPSNDRRDRTSPESSDVSVIKIPGTMASGAAMETDAGISAERRPSNESSGLSRTSGADSAHLYAQESAVPAIDPSKAPAVPPFPATATATNAFPDGSAHRKSSRSYTGEDTEAYRPPPPLPRRWQAFFGQALTGRPATDGARESNDALDGKAPWPCTGHLAADVRGMAGDRPRVSTTREIDSAACSRQPGECRSDASVAAIENQFAGQLSASAEAGSTVHVLGGDVADLPREASGKGTLAVNGKRRGLGALPRRASLHLGMYRRCQRFAEEELRSDHAVFSTKPSDVSGVESLPGTDGRRPVLVPQSGGHISGAAGIAPVRRLRRHSLGGSSPAMSVEELMASGEFYFAEDGQTQEGRNPGTFVLPKPSAERRKMGVVENDNCATQCAERYLAPEPVINQEQDPRTGENERSRIALSMIPRGVDQADLRAVDGSRARVDIEPRKTMASPGIPSYACSGRKQSTTQQGSCRPPMEMQQRCGGNLQSTPAAEKSSTPRVEKDDSYAEQSLDDLLRELSLPTSGDVAGGGSGEATAAETGHLEAGRGQRSPLARSAAGTLVSV